VARHLAEIANRSQVPEYIRRMLKRRGENGAACRELYEKLIGDFRPRNTIAHCIVYDIAQITCGIEELQLLHHATFNAAMRVVVERCLKDVANDDAEAHARYILVGAKKDAAAWSRTESARRKINAALQRAGFDQQWIRSQAYLLVADTLERLNRSITIDEERRRRLIAQLEPIQSVLDDQSNRLIEGDFRSAGKAS
jgi:hypothetical protein